jgi:ubiquinone biosynthesis protein COQ9
MSVDISEAPLREALLDTALDHVPFDGWSQATFDAAVQDCAVSTELAQAVCPRGAVDLASAYHRRGDAQMLAGLAAADLTDMRFRDKIALAVRLRIEASDIEMVRRGMTLFALPYYAPDGTRLMWDSCDAIWNALGDTSEDVNWYSKRMTLSGVYAATVLFWLGDTSEGHADSWEFLDRRVEDVMRIEKAKAGVRDSKLLSGLLALPLAVLAQVKAPAGARHHDVPGYMGSDPGGAAADPGRTDKGRTDMGRADSGARKESAADAAVADKGAES